MITARGNRRTATPRLILSALAATAAAGVLAACSSGAGVYGGAGASTGSDGAGAPGGGMLATRQVSGIGTTLVDQSGKTVYSPDQESGGMIRCTGSCLSFWIPVTVPASAKPAVAGSVSGTVSTITRPDNGQTQVTYNGKPLYTFKLDQAPGQAKGNDFDDSFGGTSFNWRAVSTSAGAGSGTPAPSQSGSGGGSGYGSGSGGY